MNSIAFAQQIRKLSLEMVFRAKASHIGSALSIADILAVLYHQYLKVLPYDPRNKDRDILILSKGHACVALYAALAIKNYFDINLLKTYGENDSNFMNHISHKVDGVEFSTGSLGHGLSFGLGKALASKIKKVKKKVVVIIGDGELDEGSNWEALLFAAHHHINNLLLIVDYNNLQSLTTVDNTMNLEPMRSKFESFGCEVLEIDGHNHIDLLDSFKYSDTIMDKPTVIIAKTIKGKGVSFMENQVKWHYSSPSQSELDLALEEILYA